MDYHNGVLQSPPEAFINLLKRTADDNPVIRTAAQWEMAKAIEVPLRQGVLVGDIVRNVYQAVPQGPGQIEWPLDVLAPGEEDEFVAYTSPGVGKIAERKMEGDFVTIPTYEISNSVQWNLRLARDANWPVLKRFMEVLEAGFVRKMNDDGWHTLITATFDRNILVYDADASAGQFTKRLVSLGKTVMIRNGGGNSASLKQSALTDLYLSPESIEDVRNWGLDQVDEFTRRDIYLASDAANIVTRVFGVNMHPLREFGQGQEYQLWFTNKLGGSLQAADVELVVGLDRMNQDSFIMPIREEVRTFPRLNLHEQGMDGLYGRCEAGWAVLDGRRCLALSY